MTRSGYLILALCFFFTAFVLPTAPWAVVVLFVALVLVVLNDGRKEGDHDRATGVAAVDTDASRSVDELRGVQRGDFSAYVSRGRIARIGAGDDLASGRGLRAADGDAETDGQWRAVGRMGGDVEEAPLDLGGYRSRDEDELLASVREWQRRGGE